MKLLALSDIHAHWDRFDPADLPAADAVVIAGDITERGFRLDPVENAAAARWLAGLGARYPAVYWIPGNHNSPLDQLNSWSGPNIQCVRDRTIALADPTGDRKFRLHGVSLAPARDKPEFARIFTNMTADDDVERRAFDFEAVDIVLSHCPPYGLLDYWPGIPPDPAANLGSEHLLRYIERHKPRLVVCGHVHEARGHVKHGATDIYNVAGSHRLITL